MFDEDEVTPKIALKVENIYDYLDPHFTNRTRSVLGNQRSDEASQDDMLCFSRIVDETVEEDAYENFATRLNNVLEKFDGFRQYVFGDRWVKPNIQSSLSCPMRIQLANKNWMYMMYLYVEGVPAKEEELRVWVNSVIIAKGDNILLASQMGAIPTNQEDYK